MTPATPYLSRAPGVGPSWRAGSAAAVRRPTASAAPPSLPSFQRQAKSNPLTSFFSPSQPSASHGGAQQLGGLCRAAGAGARHVGHGPAGQAQAGWRSVRAQARHAGQAQHQGPAGGGAGGAGKGAGRGGRGRAENVAVHAAWPASLHSRAAHLPPPSNSPTPAASEPRQPTHHPLLRLVPAQRPPRHLHGVCARWVGAACLQERVITISFAQASTCALQLPF